LFRIRFNSKVNLQIKNLMNFKPLITAKTVIHAFYPLPDVENWFVFLLTLIPHPTPHLFFCQQGTKAQRFTKTSGKRQAAYAIQLTSNSLKTWNLESRILNFEFQLFNFSTHINPSTYQPINNFKYSKL